MNEYTLKQQADDYLRVAQAIHFIDGEFPRKPGLEEIAAAVHLSKFHFQRLFTQWAGISPARFQQFLSIRFAKEKLRKSHSIFQASLATGLSGSGRLHDLFVTWEAMTPGEYKSGAMGKVIRYGYHPSPLGGCLVGMTERGICHLSFHNTAKDGLEILQSAWPLAALRQEQTETAQIVEQVFMNDQTPGQKPFHLHLKGSNFQLKVWQALLQIPEGFVVSYGDVARLCGHAKAIRAAARAVAVNPVAYLIPCHRVIKSTGQLHGYRWGEDRKKALFLLESVRMDRV